MVCRGICGLLPYEFFLNGTIHPHEKTLVSRLQRQEEMVLADQGALGKPILLTAPSLQGWWAKQDENYHQSSDRLDIVGKNNKYTLRDYLPGFDVHTDDGGPQPGINLNSLGPIVIADGHHRAETHARLGERGVPGFSHVPVCLIGADELHIGVFARVLSPELASSTLAWLKVNEALEELSRPLAPRRVGEWLLVHNNQYFRFHHQVSVGDTTDVDWLNNTLLPAASGITDTRTDDRITFQPVQEPVNGEITDAFESTTLALIGFPLPKEQFFNEVSAGRILPPKSTRFEPRVPSGLVVWEGSTVV